MSRAKQKSLLLLSIAGALTLIIAMCLPDLTLSPGQPFSLERSTPESPETDGTISISSSDLVIRLFRGLIALALILLPLSILYSLLTSEGRRRLITNIALIVFFLLVADYLQNLPQKGSLDQQTPGDSSALDLDQIESDPAMQFLADPPGWLTAAVILAVSLLVVASMGSIVWLFQQSRKSPEFAVEALAEEAQNAIVSIQDGGDLKMTIIRCYQEMSWVIKEEKGIAREIFMTPREFEHRLVNRGFPPEPIRTLTRLFERVRYGSIPLGDREQDIALSCLTDIVDACKTIGDSHEQK